MSVGRSVCVCMHVNTALIVCVCKHECTSKCTHVNVDTALHSQSACAGVRGDMRIRVHICSIIFMCIHMTHTYIHVYIYIYVCM